MRFTVLVFLLFVMVVCPLAANPTSCVAGGQNKITDDVKLVQGKITHRYHHRLGTAAGTDMGPMDSGAGGEADANVHLDVSFNELEGTFKPSAMEQELSAEEVQEMEDMRLSASHMGVSEEQGSNATRTTPAKNQMLVQREDQQAGVGCSGSAADCCTGIPGKDWEQAIRGEAASQGIEQFAEAVFTVMATTGTGKDAKTLAGAGPAGAFLGSMAGAYVSENIMDDPFAPRFEEISKHMKCLAGRIDQNARNIAKLSKELKKVKAFAEMTRYELNRVKAQIAWKEGLAANKLVRKIRQLNNQGTDCFYCIIGVQFPELQKKLAPRYGERMENGRPLSRPGGLQCDVDNTQCNTHAFLHTWINDQKWQEILDDLVELVMFTKYNWQIARTIPYGYGVCSGGSNCRRRRNRWNRGNEIVGSDATTMSLVVQTVPIVLGLIQESALAVRMWGNVLAASLAKNDEDAKINILARMQRFYAALVQKPFHQDPDKGTWGVGIAEIEDLTDLWKFESPDVADISDWGYQNACKCMANCGCPWGPLDCGREYCTPEAAKGSGYALSKDGQQCGCAHPTCGMRGWVVGASPKQLGAGCYNEFGEAFHLLKKQATFAATFNSSKWKLENDTSKWRIGSSTCPVTHPFAYRPNYNFDYCCKTDANWPGQSKASRTDVCWGHEFTPCEEPPCEDNPDLALIVRMCPSTHPYAYRGNCCNFDYCCQTDKNWPGQPKGSRSDVCFGHKFVQCPRAPCDDYTA